MRKWRKPLIVFTPKGMLPHQSRCQFAFSRLCIAARFQNVLPETEIPQVYRLLLCTGKIGHELRIERAKRKDSTTGIVFLEQLYPWPEAELWLRKSPVTPRLAK